MLRGRREETNGRLGTNLSASTKGFLQRVALELHLGPSQKVKYRRQKFLRSNFGRTRQHDASDGPKESVKCWEDFQQSAKHFINSCMYIISKNTNSCKHPGDTGLASQVVRHLGPDAI